MQNRKIGIVELRMVYRKNGVHPGVSRAERECWIDGWKAWVERSAVLSTEGEAGGKIKGSGNDSWGPIIEVSRGFGLAFGSGRDASEAIYLPLPLLISCDVPQVRPTRSSFPRSPPRLYLATFLHNVERTNELISSARYDRNDTANISVKNADKEREREREFFYTKNEGKGGRGSVRDAKLSRQDSFRLSKGRGGSRLLPATRFIHDQVVVPTFSPPIHATLRGTHERERGL